MKSYLLMLVLLTASYNEANAQQVALEQPSIYFYTLTIADIGEWSDDATVKVVQTALKPVFETNVPINGKGEFKISTAFPVNESKTAEILEYAGFTLTSFDRKTDLDSDSIHANDQ